MNFVSNFFINFLGQFISVWADQDQKYEVYFLKSIDKFITVFDILFSLWRMFKDHF